MSKSIFLFGCKDTTLHVAKFLNQLNLNINLITIDPATAKKMTSLVISSYQNMKNFLRQSILQNHMP